ALAAAAAGRGLPGAAHPRGPARDPDHPRPPDGALAAGADPGADAVRLAVEAGGPAAGGAAAGVREAGARTRRRHGGLGAAAGVARGRGVRARPTMGP